MPLRDDSGQLFDNSRAGAVLWLGARLGRPFDVLEEAARGAGVAGRSIGMDFEEDGVSVTVGPGLGDPLIIARCLPFVPELAPRAAPEPGIAAVERPTNGLR